VLYISEMYRKKKTRYDIQSRNDSMASIKWRKYLENTGGLETCVCGYAV
jgi:hypothetical protein